MKKAKQPKAPKEPKAPKPPKPPVQNTNDLFGHRANGDPLKNQYPIDKKYDSLEVLQKEYRPYYKARPYLAALEQVWTSEYLGPLTELMGEQTFILPTFFGVEFQKG